MQFVVRSFDVAAASVQEEIVDAASSALAAQHAERAGQVVLSVQAAARTMRSRGPRATLDVSWWCHELRTLVAAGMTVVEALETLNAQSLGRARADVHAALLDRLREGQALSVAMAAVGCFPAVLVAGVKASERTSSLVEALDEFLRYDEMLERLRRQVISAAIYPAVVVTLGGLVSLFLLLFVIPRFSRMYGDLQGQVSWTTAALVAMSKLLNQHWTAVLLVLMAVVAVVVLAWRGGHLARWAVALCNRIAPLQRQLDQFRLAKLYHSLALMFRGGYALDEALRQCAALGLGGRMSSGVEVAQRGLARGQRVSGAFADAGLTDTVTQRLLAVGERTGSFDRVLQTIAERHGSNFSTFIERATRIVEPLLLLLVALLVGGIVVMMYMPVFDIASSVR